MSEMVFPMKMPRELIDIISKMMPWMERLLGMLKRYQVKIPPLLVRLMGTILSPLVRPLVDGIWKNSNPKTKKLLAEDLSYYKGWKFYFGFLDIGAPLILIEIVDLPNLIKITPSTEEYVEKQKLPGIQINVGNMMPLMKDAINDMANKGGIDLHTLQMMIPSLLDNIEAVRLGYMIRPFIPLTKTISTTTSISNLEDLITKQMGRFTPILRTINRILTIF